MAIILDITLRDFIFIENDTEIQIQKEQAKIVLHRVTQEYASKHFTDLTPGQTNLPIKQNSVTLDDITIHKAKKQCTSDPFAELPRFNTMEQTNFLLLKTICT